FEFHYLGPLPFIALCFALAGLSRPQSPRRRAAFIFLWGCLAISWLLWFFTYQSNRLLLPSIGLIIPLGAAGLARLWPALTDLQQRLTRLLFSLAIAFCLLVYVSTMLQPVPGSADRVDAILAGLGLQDKDFYLARRLNYYRAA